MRALLGLGVLPDGVEVDELAVILGRLLGPQLLHRQHTLAHDLEARVVAGAVILHLLDVPTAADAEDEAAAGELVEAGDRFRGDDRVALRDEAMPVPSFSVFVAAAAKDSATNGSCVWA